MYYANELEISLHAKFRCTNNSYNNVNMGMLKYTYPLVAGINRQMIYTRQQNDMCDLFPKITIKHTGKIILSSTTPMGAQWLSGRVLDSRPRGRGFEPHRLHFVVSF